MGKYEPLAEHLSELQVDSWDATFSEIEEILGFRLPRSAHEHRAWWANQYRGNHSQARGWINAGWETRDIDQQNGLVRFERQRRAGRKSSSLAMNDLWKRASAMTGITDQAALERAAAEALIQRHAADFLSGLGGTMPDFSVADRRRPA